MKASNNWYETPTICLLAVFFSLASPVLFANSDASNKCLYISSYHQGYAWSDGVEEGLRDILYGQCELRQFDMDTKRAKSEQQIQEAVRQARQIIEEWIPDIVITSDDNAAKHLVVPHFKNSHIPFVFCGVNWTVEEYGFPFTNVTGVVEVAPIVPMLEEAMRQSGGSNGVYLGAATLTEEKNFVRNQKEAQKLGATLTKKLVSDFGTWKDAYQSVQLDFDFIVIGSSSGIEGWKDGNAGEYAKANGKLLSVTNMRWMMPVSTLGYTKIPSEHGELAGETALAVLNGTSIADIPIVANRKWDVWINEELETSATRQLSDSMRRKAKKMASID